MARPLDGLDRPICGAGRHDPTGRDAIDGLVVHRVDGHVAADQLTGERALDDHDVVDGDVRRDVEAPVPGNVLVQCSAGPHVEQLEPTADAEHREVLGRRQVDQAELEAVALRLGPLRLQIPRRAVPCRVDVGPAGDQHAVEAPGVRRRIDVLGQVDGQAAGLCHGTCVGADVHVHVLVVHVGDEPADVRAHLAAPGEADQRRRRGHSDPNDTPLTRAADRSGTGRPRRGRRTP